MSSGSAVPSPLPGPDVDRGAQLAACYFVGCGVSFIFVLLRFWARLSIHQVAADDWWMLVTWIVFGALTIVVPFIAFNGGTRHLVYLAQDPQNALYVNKLNWIAQPFGIFALGTGKIAIALLIIRLLDRAAKWRKWILYATSAWTLINMILMCVFTFVQCKDPRALWEPARKETTTCWDPSVQSNFSIYGASAYALMDFLLAFMPITLVYKLKLDLRKKIGLCLLLCCGSLTGISAAVKASTLVSLQSRADITWETFQLFIWTCVEITLLIVCGSVPTLKPLYKKAIGKPTGWTKRLSQEGSSTGSRRGLSRFSYAKHTDSMVGVPVSSFDSPPSTSPGKSERGARFNDSSREEQEMGEVGGVHITKTFSATWESMPNERA